MFGSKDNKVPVSARVDEDVKKQFKSKVSRRGADINLVLSRFITAYLEGMPEAEAIASGRDDALEAAEPGRLDEVRRMAASMSMPFREAIDDAMAKWIDYYRTDTPMVKVPSVIKEIVSWLQGNVRTDDRAKIFLDFLRMKVDFSGTEETRTPRKEDNERESGSISTKVQNGS